MTISRSQRASVRKRANNCCEYCHLSMDSGTLPFHIDHIIPVKHDGADKLENLCLACFKCNAHKSHDLTGFDPDTGKIEPLYHPRQQEWDKHFKIETDMKIVGLTPEGRTTVRVLHMNDEDRLENRQILAETGEYPCKQTNAE